MPPFETLFDIYIQHPVIAKWLTLGLCVSLFLNTYLLNAAKQQPKIVIQKVIERVEVPAKPLVETRPRRKSYHQPNHHRSDIIRPLNEVISLMGTPDVLTDEEIILIVQSGKMAAYALEKVLGDFERAVHIRRALISRDSMTGSLEGSLLPVKNYHYDKVMGACCENVIGYMPIPVGVAGKYI
jgi:hydroxymethylglutaryl-CoA reductase (NADPH)